MDFYDLNLSDPVLDALDDMNFQHTTPIQEHAIPPILEGNDVLGVAQTGTGKPQHTCCLCFLNCHMEITLQMQ